MKIYYLAGDRTLDLLNQRQTCYHLSQRGELSILKLVSCIFNGDLKLHLRQDTIDVRRLKDSLDDGQIKPGINVA